MARKDWTLLAIAAAEGEVLSPVQLQKSLFLLSRNLPNLVGEDFYTFRPYNYGPFSIEIYHDAKTLASEGLVSIQEAPEQRWKKYRATPAGLERAVHLVRSEDVPEVAVRYLRTAVAWTRSLSFNELLRSIYAHFPEYKVHSVFQSA